MSNLCPACDVGSLEPRVGEESITYNGATLRVAGVAFSLCLACGEEVVLPEQAKHNDVLFADAKKAGQMLSCAEIAAWRRRWSLSLQDAASLLGGGANAFYKYENGVVVQSQAMDLLVRVSDMFAPVREYLSDRAGVPFGDNNWVTVVEGFEAVAVLPTLRAQADRASARKWREYYQPTANDSVWQSEPEACYGH